jgi:transcriptional regulator with XRE-family HTH domain
LTSYVIRLAEANGIQARYQLHSIFFPNRSQTAIRGMADLPLADYEALSTMAACSEAALRATTFYYLVNRFNRPTSSPRVSDFLTGCLTRRLRYCPLCLQDDQPYYSLTWRFLTLPGCPRHGCRFLDRCLQCGREIPFLAAPLKIGLCPGCGAALSASQACPEPRRVEPLEPHQHHLAQVHHRDLAFLLSPQPEEAEPVALGPRLAQWRQVRQLTVEEVALQIGKTPRLVVRTLERRGLSSGAKFQYYLDYIACLGLTFEELFHTVLHPEAQRQTRFLSPEMRQQREDELVRRIQLAVETLKAQGRPLLQQAVCELVGMSLTALSNYPRAKAALSWVAQEQRRDIQRQNQRREQELILRVEQAIGSLQAEGKRVTKRAIANQFGMTATGLSYYPQVEALLTQAVRQQRERHVQELSAQVRQAMAQLQAQNRPVSKLGVARLLGCSTGAFKHYPQIKALFTQDGKGAPQPSQLPETVSIEKVQEAISHLQAQDRPVTQAAVCQLAGLRRVALKRYPQLAWAVQACRQDKEKRVQRRKQAVEEQVLQAIERLKSQGDPVSQKDICNLTGLSLHVFQDYPDLRAPVALERRRSVQKQREQRQRALLEKVEQAIEELRSRGSPLTQPAICQQVGCSLHHLRAYPQVHDRLKQVIEERKAETRRRRQERDLVLVGEVQAAIEQLQSLGRPVTLKAIGRMVNMTPRGLGKYPHVREILDQVAAEWRRDRKKQKSALDRHE